MDCLLQSCLTPHDTLYHNTVWVLPLGARILGIQSLRVPKGNTKKKLNFMGTQPKNTHGIQAFIPKFRVRVSPNPRSNQDTISKDLL